MSVDDSHNYAMLSLHPPSQLRMVDFRDSDLSQVINWTLTQVSRLPLWQSYPVHFLNKIMDLQWMTPHQNSPLFSFVPPSNLLIPDSQYFWAVIVVHASCFQKHWDKRTPPVVFGLGTRGCQIFNGTTLKIFFIRCRPKSNWSFFIWTQSGEAQWPQSQRLQNPLYQIRSAQIKKILANLLLKLLKLV